MEDSQILNRSKFTLFNDIESKSVEIWPNRENEPLGKTDMLDYPYYQTLVTAIDQQSATAIFDFERINSAINSEAILLITDKAGSIIYLNDNCCKNIGYKHEEIIGKHTRIFKTGLHFNKFYHDLWETLLAGEIWKGK
jgi:PAS domain-containing protein